jgi:hypothetical protein
MQPDPNADPSGGDWWSQNPPPAPSGPITGPTDPRLTDGAYASDPNVLAWLNQIYAPGGTAPGGNALAPPTPDTTWNPQQQAWNPGLTPAPMPVPNTPPPGGITSPIYTGLGVPTSGFGAAPAPYVSNPNTPTYQPLPTYQAPTWQGGDFVNPTINDLYNSPGYGARLDQRMKAAGRQFAAQGTILNGGTLKALDQTGQDYATNEYQTLRNNSLDAYKQKYAQFTDAAGLDLNARTINANQNQNTFANNMTAYNAGNSRTLSDFLTNTTATRNSELDYWQRLQDVNNTGAGLAGNSYKVPV